MAEAKDKKGPGRRTSMRPEAGAGGILQGLTDLIQSLGELAEKGTELSKTSQFGERKGLSGVYGFSVKFGAGGQGLKVEPFGNIAKDKVTGKSVVQETREPMVDVFEEADHTLVVAEMPGVNSADVHVEVQDDVLTLSAECADRKYRKEVLLPRAYAREKMQISCSNGILTIKCTA
jgi:HSP20 family protein